VVLLAVVLEVAGCTMAIPMEATYLLLPKAHQCSDPNVQVRPSHNRAGRRQRE
jgi:hypothetical protein